MTEDLEKYEARQPAVIPQTETNLLELVIQKGADLQTIEKFMDLQERHEKNEARKAYVVAMAEFKKNAPDIITDGKVSFELKDGSVTSYTHATLANVTATLSTELSKYGLSGRWDVEQGDYGIKVTFILTHIAGHSESVSIAAPPDNSGKKNPIQSIASTVSYLERYTMLAGTGLAAKGMDDTDGRLPEDEPEPITQASMDKIEELKDKVKINDADFKGRLTKKFGKVAVDRLDEDEAKELITALKIISKKQLAL